MHTKGERVGGPPARSSWTVGHSLPLCVCAMLAATPKPPSPEGYTWCRASGEAYPDHFTAIITPQAIRRLWLASPRQGLPTPPDKRERYRAPAPREECDGYLSLQALR